MNIRTFGASALTLVFALGFGVASASALSVSCSGTPAISSITWVATTTDGVAPIALLWGNGSTSTSQTILYSPGTYAMTIQATDASSTVATSTCSAVVQAPPTITSFTASPVSITSGQSSILTWSVSNASSTSINNGVGVVSGTSTVVSPTVTTTYTLSALSPAGTTTASATVTVNATSTGGSSTLAQQIQALLQQIRALQQQIAQLIANQFGFGTTTPPIIPPGQFGKAVCISLSRNIGVGDSGDDVKKIQELLTENGFATPATGYFGPMTARSMKHFQERSGIASSTASNGYVGPLTRGFFERACGKGLSKHSESSEAESSEDKRENSTSNIRSGKSDKANTGNGNNGKRSNGSRDDD
ncbi:MAG: peptidoglycan-binding protein [bacterium]|nr:peptidoglycan-binding protein [bacterium]